MADVIFNSFKSNLLSGVIDLDTHTIKVMLVTSSYTPDQDSHTVKADVTDEVSGTGYTAGGATIGSSSVSQDNTNNRGVWDGGDVSWTSSTITARGQVIYDDTPSSPAKPLIAYIDFGADKSSTAGTFTIQWNASGILTLS